MKQINTLVMPFADVGQYTSLEYESDKRITDAQITQGQVEKVDNYTIKITTQVRPKTYFSDLIIRTSDGLTTIQVKTRV